jgi:hypothetical protein
LRNFFDSFLLGFDGGVKKRLLLDFFPDRSCEDSMLSIGRPGKAMLLILSSQSILRSSEFTPVSRGEFSLLSAINSTFRLVREISEFGVSFRMQLVLKFFFLKDLFDFWINNNGKVKRL